MFCIVALAALTGLVHLAAAFCKASESCAATAEGAQGAKLLQQGASKLSSALAVHTGCKQSSTIACAKPQRTRSTSSSMTPPGLPGRSALAPAGPHSTTMICVRPFTRNCLDSWVTPSSGGAKVQDTSRL